jgi:hypothetical protein
MTAADAAVAGGTAIPRVTPKLQGGGVTSGLAAHIRLKGKGLRQCRRPISLPRLTS